MGLAHRKHDGVSATMAAEATVDASPPAVDRRVLPALCLAAFVGLLTFTAPAPFFPAMARDLRVGVPLLGQIVAAMLLLSALVGLVAGPLADRYGHRRVIVSGLSAAALCLFLFGLAPGYPVLLLAALAGGLGNAAVLGPSLAVAGTAFSGVARRRALSWTTAAMASSAIVGVPLLSALGAVTTWRAAFLTAGFIVAGIAWLAAVWLPHGGAHPGGPLRRQAFLAAYRPLLRHGPILRLYGVAFLRAVCWFGMLTYFGAFLGQRLGLSTAQIGLAYMLGGGGYSLGSLVAGGPLGHVPPRVLLIAGNLVMTCFMALAFSAILGALGSVGALPLATFAGAFGWVAVVSLLTAQTPAGAGTTLTLHGSLFNLGASAGGAIGGLLIALAGYEALALGLPVFGLASVLLAAWPADRAVR